MSGRYVGRLETLYVILRRLLCVCTPLDWMALLLIQIDELEQIFDEVALAGEKSCLFVVKKSFKMTATTYVMD